MSCIEDLTPLMRAHLVALFSQGGPLGAIERLDGLGLRLSTMRALQERKLVQRWEIFEMEWSSWQEKNVKCLDRCGYVLTLEGIRLAKVAMARGGWSK